ncbi:MAG: ATP-binding cassette domain-containing protein [Elusimicrobia bacterium]|nr:ATP-binding cassette domain-containing protein [Elusimicrobiota bacterium]
MDGLTRVFPPSRKSGEPRKALQDLRFSVKVGELFGILGPNGGGKTTLFRILSTALSPSQGRALLFGIDVAENPREVRRRIGVVFQNPSLDKKLTLRENLLHQGHLYGLSGKDLTQRIRSLLQRLGIESRAEDRVEHLSGGLQRRGEIAKGLLHGPELLLMDEPSTGLDPGARLDLWRYLQELKKENVTILVTTHLMEEAEHCDRLAILHRGTCVALGEPVKLKEQIGGDVILAQTREPEKLCSLIEEKFHTKPTVVDGTLRLERRQGHEFVPQLVEAFPGLIDAITVGKPTLEDVFIHQTGHRFWWQEPATGQKR